MLVNMNNLLALSKAFNAQFGSQPLDGSFQAMQPMTSQMPLSFGQTDPEFGSVSRPTDQVGSFEKLLTQAIDAVNAQDHLAATTAFNYATGNSVDTHQVMIEVAKAEAMLHIASQTVSKTAAGLQTLFNLQI